METMRTLTKICIMSILAFALVAGFHTEVKAGDVAVKLRAPKKARDCSTRDKRLAVTLINNGTSDETASLYVFKNPPPPGSREIPIPYYDSNRDEGGPLDVPVGSRIRKSIPYNPEGDAGTHVWLATISVSGDSDTTNNRASAVTDTVQCR